MRFFMRAAKLSEEHTGKRSPKLLIVPRTQLMSWVRAATKACRARMTPSCACAALFLCRMGESKEGSSRASRARARALHQEIPPSRAALAIRQLHRQDRPPAVVADSRPPATPPASRSPRPRAPSHTAHRAPDSDTALAAAAARRLPAAGRASSRSPRSRSPKSRARTAPR